jgi:hypothetical protein
MAKSPELGAHGTWTSTVARWPGESHPSLAVLSGTSLLIRVMLELLWFSTFVIAVTPMALSSSVV